MSTYGDKGDKRVPLRLTASASGPKPIKSATNTAKPRVSKSARPGVLTITPKSIAADPGKHAKKKKPPAEQQNELEEVSEEPEPPAPSPKPAWSQFEDHVKVISRSDLSLGEKKESFSTMCSDDHYKALTEVREINMKKQIRSMKMRVRAIQRIKSAKNRVIEDTPETSTHPETDGESSEDEETKAEREKKRALARHHWDVIRRYLHDRVQQRRKKRMGFNQNKAFNRVRAQAKASLNPQQARRDIFERYGIVPKPGKMYPEDVMKPVFSTRVNDIIAKFEQIQIISIVPTDNRQRPHSFRPQRKKTPSRPRPLTTNRSISRRFQ